MQGPIPRNKRAHRRRLALLVAGLLCAGGGCATPSQRPVSPPRGPGRVILLETTGYCPCASCCGWRRNWRGIPVFASGPLKGQPKQVGQTASGTRARPGTLAADTHIFPFGSILFIPGYGYGRVEDRGEKIKGYRIDLFFPTHKQALQWGRKSLRVTVWPPE